MNFPAIRSHTRFRPAYHSWLLNFRSSSIFSTSRQELLSRNGSLKPWAIYLVKSRLADGSGSRSDDTTIILEAISCCKYTSQKILVSDDLNPNLDPVQAITWVFSETSKYFTPLQCDLEPEINKPTSRKIVVSSNLAPDPSASLASRKIFVSYDLAP